MFLRTAWPIAAAVFVVMASMSPAGASTYAGIWDPQLQSNGDPIGRLHLRKDGSLVGTSFGYPGNGMVFQLTLSKGSWSAKKLFGFNGTNGSGPAGGLVADSTGALYGTTYRGGAHGDGTVFKLTLTSGVWKESVLHSFNGGGSDGANPQCDLVRVSSNGTLIGTTEYGGSDGSVFSLTHSGGAWSEHILYNVGGEPRSGVYRDSAGALYGTTFYGGEYNEGIVYKLERSGKMWTETYLHTFGAYGDGSFPAGPLIADSNGALYGTTSSGGAHSSGTVFKMTYSGGYWTETVLWSFTAGTDGNAPLSGLLMDSSGALYGTTDGFYADMGTAFELIPSGSTWKISVLHTFGSGNDGSFPDSALVEDAVGNLYGTTTMGGTYGWGSAFKISQ